MNGTFRQSAVTIIVVAFFCLGPSGIGFSDTSLPSLIEAIQKTVARIEGQASDKITRGLLKDAEKALSTAGKKSRGGKDPGTARPDLEQAHRFLREALFSSAAQTLKMKQDIEEALARLAPVLAITGGYPASVRTADGLHEARFQTPEGVIMIRLPSDMNATDIVTGTVEVSGSGSGPTEQNRNLSLLERLYRIGIDRTSPLSNEGGPNTLAPASSAGGNPVITLAIRNHSGEPLSRIAIPVTDRNFAAPEKTYSIPNFAAAGKPILIPGPFDGRLETTKLTVNGETFHEFTDIPGVTEDFADIIITLKQIKIRPNQSVYPVAESPRGLVLFADSGQLGKCRVKISEGDLETACLAHVLAIDLTADKIALLKGEMTHVHLTIRGLLGTEEPVGVHLENFSSIINLQGGNSQDFKIAPPDVPPNGEVAFTRTATGIAPGAWSMTATLVGASTRLVQCSEVPKPAVPAGGRMETPIKAVPVGAPVGQPETPGKPAGSEPAKPAKADPKDLKTLTPKSTNLPGDRGASPPGPVAGKTTGGAEVGYAPKHPVIPTQPRTEIAVTEPRANEPLSASREHYEKGRSAQGRIDLSDVEVKSRIRRESIFSVLLPLAGLGLFVVINQMLSANRRVKIDLEVVRRKPHA